MLFFKGNFSSSSAVSVPALLDLKAVAFSPAALMLNQHCLKHRRCQISCVSDNGDAVVAESQILPIHVFFISSGKKKYIYTITLDRKSGSHLELIPKRTRRKIWCYCPSSNDKKYT
jgi:hypothetical protein